MQLIASDVLRHLQYASSLYWDKLPTVDGILVKGLKVVLPNFVRHVASGPGDGEWFLLKPTRMRWTVKMLGEVAGPERGTTRILYAINQDGPTSYVVITRTEDGTQDSFKTITDELDALYQWMEFLVIARRGAKPHEQDILADA